jgi:hypothetical protein
LAWQPRKSFEKKKSALEEREREREVQFDIWGFAEEFQSPLWIPPPRR